MNLLALTNRYYLILSLVLVLGLSITITYRVLHFVDSETREHMMFERHAIANQLQTQPVLLPERKIEVGDLIVIEPNNGQTPMKDVFKDTLFYDPKELEIVPFTVLTSVAVIKGRPVRIQIRRRLTENEDVFNGIALSFLLSVLIIVTALFLLNNRLSKNIFKPFYKALSELELFELGKSTSLDLIPTEIIEFKSLNEKLLILTSKALKDYKDLEEFIENLSHETKTPIAVVQARLELLLQSPNLLVAEKKQVSDALDTISNLSEKNNALRLLSQINSDRSRIYRVVNINNVVKKLIDEMKDFIDFKKLKLDLEETDNIKVSANFELIEILFSNLISNAVKHNVKGGCIYIKFQKNSVSISNSGPPVKFPSTEIFKKYVKGNNTTSTGLGLTIAKKISDLYKYQLTYNYLKDNHVFVCEVNNT